MGRVVAVLACLLAVLAAAGCGGSAATPRTNAGPVPAAAAVDLTGSYVIEDAANPDGRGHYTGTVEIERDGDVHRLQWTIANTSPQAGVGLVEGGTLAVGYGAATRYGVAVYRIDGGSLAGRWATASSGPTAGAETLAGPEGLNGSYAVTGRQPDGRTYTGTAMIVPTGDTYSVTWMVLAGSYSGVGIRSADLLVVGWGEVGVGAGVVAYELDGTRLTGRWALTGRTGLGTETLRKS